MNNDYLCTVCGVQFTKGLNYELRNGGYSVTGVTVDQGDIVILDYYEGKPVTSIGSGAFKNCKSLTSITIPNSVTSIGYDAFHGCSGLKNIYYMGDIAGWCGISGLGNLMFDYGAGNDGPEDGEDPGEDDSQSVKAIKLFINGKEITGALVIPEGVTSIGESAFKGCSGLTSITIPNSVTYIGPSAFTSCSGLKNIHFLGDITSWCKIGGLQYLMWYGSSDKKLFIDNNEITGTLVLPNSITSIGNYAFYGCSGLTSITIPNSVTSIGGGAFYDCSGLTSVTIGNSVTSIGSGAFEDCYGLTEITIPNSVTSIENWAFGYCHELTSIKFKGTKAEWKAIKKMESTYGSYHYGAGDFTIQCTDGKLDKYDREIA